MKELTLRHFRAWLEARSPYGSVGETRRERGCPLATYLGPGWLVRTARARYVEPEPPDGRVPETVRVPLPRWAKRFVQEIDRLPSSRLDGRRFVWPRTALAVLDELTARGAR